MTAKLVWTNPSPSLKFTSKTVSLDLSDAKSIIIISRLSTIATQSDAVYASIIDLSGSSGVTSMKCTLGGSLYTRFATASSTGVYFETGASADNTVAIPLKIYKITDDITFES